MSFQEAITHKFYSLNSVTNPLCGHHLASTIIILGSNLFLLKDNCFTMFCWFLLYNNVVYV